MIDPNGWIDPDTTKFKPYLMVKDSGTYGRVELTKLPARNIVYWAEISKNITDYETCISFRNAQPAEPLLKHEITDQPWLKLGLIYFHSLIKITQL